MNTDDVLIIVKQDLMISSTIRDDYLKTLIHACEREFDGRGVKISDNIDDILLLADYVAFRYRHRTDDAPLPKNLQLRIQNKKVRRRLNNA